MNTVRRWWKSLRLTGLVALTVAAAGGPSVAAGCAEDATGSCCKVCTTGKACGDTCIPQSNTCNVGAGCACNG
jgi:hypothetical protein